MLDELNRTSRIFGGEFELVNLLALGIDKIVERLNLADLIFVVGGHTDYLMSVFNKSGLSNRLADLLSDKVYVGVSAGAMIPDFA